MYYSSSDQRAQLLLKWLTDDLNLQIKAIEPASCDASFRRYFRVSCNESSQIVMDAPPDKETTEPFIRLAALFKQAQVHVPVIFQRNSAQGFLLLEDLGCQCYLDGLLPENADVLYQAAMDSLFRLQSNVEIKSSLLPVYDEALLNRELSIFYDWFLEQLLGMILSVSVRQSVSELLVAAALQQPRVCVHRDYHSRNLMLLDADSPGVIDFQDAVIGPITYDLVSLLRDCYIRWPQQQVYGWMEQYYHRLLQAGMLTVELAQFKRWFDLMGLQRHLKAVGIFARLHLRDDKSAYLADIPRTMSYIIDVCELYPELADFKHFLQQQVLPVYQTKL
jgi:aminoglycoside/choline kinase family phosphotransferase